MAPTPFTPTHRMVFSISVNGMLHDLHYACNADELTPGAGDWRLQNNVDGLPNVLPSAAADNWWLTLKARYPSSVSAVGYALQQNYSGVFVPVNSGVISSPAGTGGAVVLAGWWTMTFKDANNRRVIFIIPESDVAVPQRYAASAGANPFSDLYDSVIDETTTTTVGHWVRSRGDAKIVSGRFATGTISKKLRRARNLL